MIQLCRHILPSGVLCEQAAVKETIYCRHHGTLKQAVAACKPAPDPYGFQKTLRFVFPEDRAAVQINYFMVLQALNDRIIDNRTANTMNRLLRSCEMNLRGGRLVDANQKHAVQRVILTPEGEEIAPPRERLEDDEDAPVHGADCPCRKCAEAFRGAAPEEHHADCTCGDCASGDTGFAPEDRGADIRAAKTAPAQKLYDQEPAKIHAEDEDPDESPCKKILRAYHARQDAIAAGRMERPAPRPVDPNAPALECIRRYNEKMAEIERNKQIGEEIWQRRFAHQENQTAQTNTLTATPADRTFADRFPS